MFDKFASFDSNFINFGSIVAFLALKGTLSKDAKGTRTLLNSKGGIVSTREQYFEQLKKDINIYCDNVVLPTVTNPIYVDSEAIGSTEDGSIDNPLLTIASLNAFNHTGYDSVLFKTDSYFVGAQFKPKDNMIYSSYGSGEKPKIGINQVFNVGSFTEVSTGKWKSDNTTYAGAGRLWLDGKELHNAQNETELGDVNQTGDYYWDSSGYLYINSSIDVSNSVIVSDVWHCVAFENSSNIKFYNLDIRDGRIKVSGAYSVSDIEFHWCNIGYNSGTGVDVGGNADGMRFYGCTFDSNWHLFYNNIGTSGIDHRMCDDGLMFFKDARNIIVDNCRFFNWGHTGVGFNSTDSNIYPTNNSITNIYTNGSGNSYGRGFGVSGNLNNSVFNNIFMENQYSNAQVNGYNNTYSNIFGLNIKNTHMKNDNEGAVLSIEDYNVMSNHNLYKAIFGKNCDGPVIDVLGGANNTYEDIIAIDCGLEPLSGNTGICVNISNERSEDSDTYKDMLIYNSTTKNTIRYDNKTLTAEKFNNYTPRGKEVIRNITSNYTDLNIPIYTGGKTHFDGTQFINTGITLTDGDDYSILGRITNLGDSITGNILTNYYGTNALGINKKNFHAGIRGNNGNDFDKYFSGAITGKEYHMAVSVKNNEFIKVYIDHQLVKEYDFRGYSTTNLNYPFCINGNGADPIVAEEVGDRSEVYLINKAVTGTDVYLADTQSEKFFRHCNINDTYTHDLISFSKNDVKINTPLNEIGNVRKNYANNDILSIVNYTTTCDVQGLSTGLQKIAFDNNMIYTAEQMNFYAGDAPQYVQDLSSTLSIKETLKNGTVYLWTYNGTTQKLYKDGIEQANATVDAIRVGEISRLNGETVAEIDTFELFNIEIKPREYYKWLDLFENLIISSNDDIIIASSDNYVLSSFDYYILDSNDRRVLTSNDGYVLITTKRN